MKEIKTPSEMMTKGWNNAWLYDLEKELLYSHQQENKYRYLIVSCCISKTSPEYQIFTYPADEKGTRIGLGETPIRVWSLIPETHNEEPNPFDENWVKKQRDKIVQELLNK